MSLDDSAALSSAVAAIGSCIAAFAGIWLAMDQRRERLRVYFVRGDLGHDGRQVGMRVINTGGTPVFIGKLCVSFFGPGRRIDRYETGVGSPRVKLPRLLLPGEAEVWWLGLDSELWHALTSCAVESETNRRFESRCFFGRCWDSWIRARSKRVISRNRGSVASHIRPWIRRTEPARLEYER